MDKIAEEGIAAHWKYKEGHVASKTDESQFSWLRRLLEWQKDLHDPKEFLDTVRMDLFQNEVYVFTPKGEVKEFPKGATPVDFAYSIHTEIGNRCTGARVKGKLVPLRYELQNGDIVEIITSNKQHPSKDWLDFAKTPRAKTKIRHWVKDQERDESIELGKDILERALAKFHIQFPNILKSKQILNISKDLSLHSVEDLFANIGYGKLSANQVVGRLKPKVDKDDEGPLGIVNKVVSRMKRKKSPHGIKVTGLDDILVRFANCCHPLPGEEVIGYITHGRGVTVHKHDCRHVADVDPDRLVEIMWDTSKEDVYLSRLKVTTVDRKGILADISAIIAQKNANIVQADVKTTTDKKGICLFSMEVEDYKQLQDIIGATKKLKDVLFVERV
jgi:GTP pyrophosphokinase